ncbi:uncharacterized protein LAESUDRAFT_646002 [Laetiporus sulphureus 93-53]|uniref:Glycopeptide n=1 Tax=Laetiporus sulphureus 93-53 TaxID=1314785 RepID=A0A165GAW2_9APHY|nr:uncharacterized protein LAESUDRAFT_646002 [Laetiporus sulphureus 93-53]KZT10088.1 hypothetical protein LAESUDRAFT_646002 [Laetiporus sulphureus 93-53]
MFPKLSVILISVALALVQVNAETHTITFTNNCGTGTAGAYTIPYLRSSSGAVLSTGGAYTYDGALDGLIAGQYSSIANLNSSGGCGDNGEYCTLVEASLVNCYSSADISHEFNVAAGFGCYNGCDGAGADCTSASCSTAFTEPDQTGKQVGCSADNVDLAITFCDYIG